MPIDTELRFMPPITLQNLPHPWQEVTEELTYRLGPWIFGKWVFSSICNRSSPLLRQSVLPGDLRLQKPVSYQQLRDEGTIRRTISLDKRAIRYVAHRDERFFVDLSLGSFDDYLARFSAKTRNTLRRKLRRFAESSGGAIDLRYYESPDELLEFRQHAIAVSLVSYHREIGWGFPESEPFLMKLMDDARKKRVCGFVLMHSGKPAAYVFCRIDHDIITYALLAHDPALAHLSPGTVLLFVMLERVFGERKFRFFDFGGQKWDYKAFFGTGSVKYLRVIWFPITGKNGILVLIHYLTQLAWYCAARLKELGLYWGLRLRKASVSLRLARGAPKLRDASGLGRIN
jgi:Acetyltransferase (GNAT) domain